MKKTYKEAELFLLKTIGRRHPEIPRSTLMRWAMNYHLELEQDKLFNSDDYNSEEERAIAMFPGMPLEELQMISVLFYKSRSDKKGEDHEKRIKELEEFVVDEELVGIMEVQVWWAEG